MVVSGLTIVTAYIAILSSLVIANDPCRFNDPTKGVIDLTSLGRTDGKAAYLDRRPAGAGNYSIFVLFIWCSLFIIYFFV